MERDARPLARNPRVACREFGEGEGAVLLHLDTGQYHSLNRLGSHIWRLVDGGSTVAELVTALRTELDDAPDTLEADVHAFVAGLRERGLIEQG